LLCSIDPVSQQQNAVAPILRILPYKAKRQQRSLKIFSQLPNRSIDTEQW